MTSSELADLSGLLALESADRAKAGDHRDTSEIATEILAELRVPSVKRAIDALTEMISQRYRPRRKPKPEDNPYFVESALRDGPDA